MKNIKDLKKKTIYILMIAIMFIQSLSNVVMAATEISKANLKNDHSIKTNIQYKNSDGTWHDIICNYICYTEDGKTYPAYCIKHGVHGVDEEGSYTVSISKLLDDDRVWRVIVNSYPYVSLDTMGVETKDDAYVATKQAINSVLLNRNVKTYYNGKNEKGNKIVNAIDKLTEIGRKGKQTRKDANLKINKSKNLTKYNDNYYYQEFEIKSDVEIGSYSIESISGYPSDSYVTDTAGNKKTTFNSSQKFRMMIPKNNITSDFSGSISVNAKCKTYPIFFGKAPKSSVQDYAITYDFYGDFSTSNTFSENVNKSKINVLKKDEESSKPIKGVKYELKLNGNVVQTLETDSNGEIIFDNLYPGSYELQEIATNDNYILDNTKYQITVGYDEVITKELTNKHKKGNLKILKVDKDDNDITLGAIEFDLLNEDKEIVAHLKTDVDGVAYIENINIGNYVLKETLTKKEYNLCVDEDILVKWNETSEVIIENEKKKGQIRVIKQDKDHNEIKLSGVEFEVLDNKNRIVEKLVTDKNGEAVTSRLVIGKYKIKEVSLGTNNEYLLNDEVYTVDVTDNAVTDLHIENEHQKGKVKVSKVDKDNNNILLGNVEFEVTDKDGYKYIGRTNKDGILEIDNIRTGKITIKETKTNNEYVLSKENYYLEIKHNKTSEITIENEKKKGEIEVYKTDSDNKEIKLKGVEFEVLDSNKNVVDTIKTNENGYAKTKRLIIGEYYLKETKTNNKYLLNKELIKVNVEEDVVSTLNITNKKKKGKVGIIKTSSKNSPIFNIKKGDFMQGVKFEIYDSSNNLVDTLVTDENGEVASKDLDIGRYKVIEVETGSNFILNKNEFIVNLENDGDIKILEIENEPIIPRLDIEKDGPEDATKNEEIKYDFSVKNSGNSSLNNFTWTEYVPYEKVKVTKMITGTYNQNLNYKILYKTNKSDYILFKELNTYASEYLDFTNIELSKNEEIIEIKVEFGTVDVGFKNVVMPSIFAKVKDNVKKDDLILNKTDLRGEINGINLKDEDDVTTKIIEKKIDKKLPRTGC